MATITIKSAGETGLKVLVNGQDFPDVQSVALMVVGEQRTASINFQADDIEVDMDALIYLNAIHQESYQAICDHPADQREDMGSSMKNPRWRCRKCEYTEGV